MTAVPPKISVCAVEAEKLGQLRAGEKEGDAALEAGHHAFGNKIYNDSCFDEPRDERDQRNEQRGPCGECAKAGGIATRDLAKGRAGEHRDRGRNCDDCVPRTAKQPKNESTKQTRVKPSLGRQIGQGRIAQTSWQKICGERNARENIAAQPASLIGAKPVKRGQQTAEGRSVHRVNFGASLTG